jgi:diaminohydroxyphosphoribosylaminopyrimidine deaminase / 5-amino-6-(5-phosphoribosylamino)uracil reductase
MSAAEPGLQGLDGLDDLAQHRPVGPQPARGLPPGAARWPRFEGHTQAAGGPHAEVMALRAATAAGAEVRGATAFVTLEPCSHHGRTPPCCDALIAAGVARWWWRRPTPTRKSPGKAWPACAPPGWRWSCCPTTTRWPRPPVAQHRLFQPHVARPALGAAEVAASLDGTTALSNGASQWITGEAARADGHAWRKRASAVLTGIGTVLEDDPRLDVRLVPPRATPACGGRFAAGTALARLLQPPGEVWSTPPATRPDDACQARCIGRTRRDRDRLPGPGPAIGPAMPRSTWPPCCRAGAARSQRTAPGSRPQAQRQFLREGLVDELLLYLAPALLGPGAGAGQSGPVDRAGARHSSSNSWTASPVGADLRVRARLPGPRPLADPGGPRLAMAHVPKIPHIAMRDGVSPSCLALPRMKSPPWRTVLDHLAERLATVSAAEWQRAHGPGRRAQRGRPAPVPDTPL